MSPRPPRERIYTVCVPTRGIRTYSVCASTCDEAAQIVNDLGDDADCDPRVKACGGHDRVSGKANYIRRDHDAEASA